MSSGSTPSQGMRNRPWAAMFRHGQVEDEDWIWRTGGDVTRQLGPGYGLIPRVPLQ